MNNNSEPKYDYLSYEKSLKSILEEASKDYWAQYINVNSLQVAVAKTYLWVSAAILTAYSAAITFLVQQELSINSCAYFFLLLAIICAIVAFGICLYALPARKGYKLINTSWQDFSVNAHSELQKNSSSIYRTTLTDMIERFDTAIGHGLDTNNVRARWLRAISWILIASFTAALVAVILIFVQIIMNFGG